jgi:hypothetical protein
MVLTILFLTMCGCSFFYQVPASGHGALKSLGMGKKDQDKTVMLNLLTCNG